MALSNEEIGVKLTAVATSMRANNFSDALKGLEDLLAQAESNPNTNKFLSSIHGMLSECLFALGKPEYGSISLQGSL
jgi:hypothetical protein